MGRRCKTLLPIASTLLKPRYDTESEAKALKTRKQKQEHYYNRSARPLRPINPGETVRMKLPGGDKWTLGTCTAKLANRSYTVNIGGAEYRRNRRHIQKTNEPPIQGGPDIVEESTPPEPETDRCRQQIDRIPEQEPGDNTGPRKSSRTRQAPAWHRDYEVTTT